MILDKPCPRCTESVSKCWIWADGRECPACGVHLKPSPNLKVIYVFSIIIGIILALTLGALAEEINIRIPGGSYSLIWVKALAIIGVFLIFFKTHVSLLVDEAHDEGAQSNIQSERERDIDH